MSGFLIVPLKLYREITLSAISFVLTPFLLLSGSKKTSLTFFFFPSTCNLGVLFYIFIELYSKLMATAQIEILALVVDQKCWQMYKLLDFKDT